MHECVLSHSSKREQANEESERLESRLVLYGIMTIMMQAVAARGLGTARESGPGGVEEKERRTGEEA